MAGTSSALNRDIDRLPYRYRLCLVLAGQSDRPVAGGRFSEIAVVIATNFWNLFTVSTILWGAGGFFIKKIGFKHQLFAIMIVAAVIALTETSINTIQMIIWKMPTAIPGLPLRIFNQLYRIPLIIIATNEIMGRLENKELKEFLSL